MARNYAERGPRPSMSKWRSAHEPRWGLAGHVEPCKCAALGTACPAEPRRRNPLWTVERTRRSQCTLLQTIAGATTDPRRSRAGQPRTPSGSGRQAVIMDPAIGPPGPSEPLQATRGERANPKKRHGTCIPPPCQAEESRDGQTRSSTDGRRRRRLTLATAATTATTKRKAESEKRAMSGRGRPTREGWSAGAEAIAQSSCTSRHPPPTRPD